MDKLITESRYLLTWFVFWISSVVGGFLVGGVAGGIMGVILGTAGVDVGAISVICAAVGFVLSIPLSYVLFRVFVGTMIVSKAQATILSVSGRSPIQAP